MDEVRVLNNAIRETNRVLQQKGYRENTVDVVGYLQTGNSQVFTRENGVRNAVEAIPFENMVKAVKKILIDDTIGYLGAAPAQQKFDEKNPIIEAIEKWIRWKYIVESKAEFDDLYDLIIKDKDVNRIIIPVLAEASHKYALAQYRIINNRLPDPVTYELIKLLENEKIKIDLEKLNNSL